jgi:hypothetical protein
VFVVDSTPGAPGAMGQQTLRIRICLGCPWLTHLGGRNSTEQLDLRVQNSFEFQTAIICGADVDGDVR